MPSGDAREETLQRLKDARKLHAALGTEINYLENLLEPGNQAHVGPAAALHGHVEAATQAPLEDAEGIAITSEAWSEPSELSPADRWDPLDPFLCQG